MSDVNVSIIVVNYGTADLAISAVESVLQRDHGGRTIEVHLVDNASPGDDAERFREAHGARNWGGWVTLWAETRNHGFGGGNNVVLRDLAARETPPDYVFLLNPDAELENEAISILADAMDADPAVAAAGASIRDSSLARVTAAFRFPSMASEILSAANFGPLDRQFARHLTSLPPDHPAGPVDWVSAAAVMFRLSALTEVDYFDEGFFLYYEEVELMHRLASHGWRTIYVPDAEAVHVGGAATGGGGLRRDPPFYLYDSWRHYFTRTEGRGKALVIALLVIPAAILNVLHRRLRGKAPTIPVRFLRDQWRLVILPLLRPEPRI